LDFISIYFFIYYVRVFCILDVFQLGVMFDICRVADGDDDDDCVYNVLVDRQHDTAADCYYHGLLLTAHRW